MMRTSKAGFMLEVRHAGCFVSCLYSEYVQNEAKQIRGHQYSDGRLSGIEDVMVAWD